MVWDEDGSFNIFLLPIHLHQHHPPTDRFPKLHQLNDNGIVELVKGNGLPTDCLLSICVPSLSWWLAGGIVIIAKKGEVVPVVNVGN